MRLRLFRPAAIAGVASIAGLLTACGGGVPPAPAVTAPVSLGACQVTPTPAADQLTFAILCGAVSGTVSEVTTHCDPAAGDYVALGDLSGRPVRLEVNTTADGVSMTVTLLGPAQVTAGPGDPAWQGSWSGRSLPVQVVGGTSVRARTTLAARPAGGANGSLGVDAAIACTN